MSINLEDFFLQWILPNSPQSTAYSPDLFSIIASGHQPMAVT
jgi:hypothetical protein